MGGNASGGAAAVDVVLDCRDFAGVDGDVYPAWFSVMFAEQQAVLDEKCVGMIGHGDPVIPR